MQRTVLVTGASSGIGHSVTKKLLADGHAVVGVARQFSRFPIVHPRFTPHAIDLGNLAELPPRLERLASDETAVDTLFCNAGQGIFGHLEQFSYARIRAQIDLNFTSHAFLVRAFLPRLKKQQPADVVFTGSEASLRGAQQGTVYCAAKFALRGFAQALRQECTRAGPRVTIINPGMVRTPFFNNLDFAPGPEPEHALEAEDIAAAVSFVLAARHGTVIDEINLSPRKYVIDFGPSPD